MHIIPVAHHETDGWTDRRIRLTEDDTFLKVTNGMKMS